MSRFVHAAVLVALLFVGCGLGVRPSSGETPETATADLRWLLEDVTAATSSRYDAHDDQGHVLDGLAILPAGDGQGFVGVSHWWSEEDQAFRAALATSDNLIDWTWRFDIARLASMPAIAPASDGGYVIAWEQEPDNHLAFAWYPSWADLLAARAAKRYEAPQRLSDCAEGTPSLSSASSTEVVFTFHYFRDCSRDRQAQGTMDWSTWSAEPRPGLDAAILAYGVEGGIGDRDQVTFHGHAFELVEAMTTNDDWQTWRIYLVDEEGRAAPLDIETGLGVQAFTNPTAQVVILDGVDTLFVTMFVPMEGAGDAHPGELLFHVPLERSAGRSSVSVASSVPAVVPAPEPAPRPETP